MNEPTAADPAPGGSALVRSERRAVVDVLGASVLFAVCNVAWRYGGGSTFVIVFGRGALGRLPGLDDRSPPGPSGLA